jgi:putative membrane protein insertion efficiency factor
VSAVPRRAPVRRALLSVIAFYSRAISPALPPRCRFYPTCSAYAAEAIEVHGAVRGTILALVRLLKCAPWHPGGVDPVPPSSGTGAAGHSSNPAAEPAAAPADRAPRSASATPPALCRAPQEESSVV